MIYEKETFSQNKIKDLEIANAITKTWYTICTAIDVKNLQIKVMEFKGIETEYDVYAVKDDTKEYIQIYFEAVLRKPIYLNDGTRIKLHQLHDIFINRYEDECNVTFCTENIENLCKAIESTKYNEDYDAVMCSLWFLNGNILDY